MHQNKGVSCLWTHIKTIQVELVGEFWETSKMVVSPRRNARLWFYAPESGFFRLWNHINQNPIGTTTSNIIHDTPLITKTPRPDKGRVPSSIFFFQLSTSIQFTSRLFRSHVWLPEGQSLRASNGLEHHTQCKHIFRKNQKDLIFRLPFPNLQSIRFGVLQIFFNSYFLWARLTLLPAQALRVEKISEAVLKVSGVVAMYLRTPQESHQISDDVPSGKHTKSYGSYVP